MRSLLTELSFLFPFHGTSGSLPHPPHPIPFFHDWLTHVFQTVPFRLAPQPVYTDQDLRGLPPIPSCMDASGQQAIRAPRKDTHIPTHTPMQRVFGKDTALHTCLTARTTSWTWELLISLLSLLI